MGEEVKIFNKLSNLGDGSAKAHEAAEKDRSSAPLDQIIAEE